MMNPGVVQGQGAIPSTTEAKTVSGPQTNIIPSVSLSERYDSNVFFGPGGNLEDFVTSVSPQLRIVHKRQLVEATVGGGVTGEAYAKNSGLNYVAANGMVDLNLDGAMNELVRGLGLRLDDTFYYTPQAPSFVAPGAGEQASNTFVRGIQAQRANSFNNRGTAAGSYAISPAWSFTSTYTNTRIRFGNAFQPPSGGVAASSFIDTNFQSVSSGPVLKASQLDTLTLYHQYQEATFGTGGSFSTQGAIAGWTRVITPTLTASVTSGFTKFNQSNNLQYIGSATLAWALRETSANIGYSRAVTPSFFVAAVPLLSQTISASVSHKATELFSLSLYGNYAVNQSVPDSSILQFESYSVTPSLEYILSRVIKTNLSYTHSQFIQKFVGVKNDFNRDMVMLNFIAEWK